MKETDLNRIVNQFFLSKNFSHKISDPARGAGSQNPFDGFSVFNTKPWYWESKLLKGYQSFNFKRIEDHQYKNLDKIYNDLYHVNNSVSMVIVGIFESRKFFDVMFFSFDVIKFCIQYRNKKSFLKKELLELRARNMYLPIVRENGKYVVNEISKFENIVINLNFSMHTKLLI